MKLHSPTQYGSDIAEAAIQLCQQHWDGQPIRSVGITLSQLQPDSHYQLTLFDHHLKKDQLSKVFDEIHLKYGPAALLHASSLTSAGQAYHRAEKLAGITNNGGEQA